MKPTSPLNKYGIPRELEITRLPRVSAVNGFIDLTGGGKCEGRGVYEVQAIIGGAGGYDIVGPYSGTALLSSELQPGRLVKFKLKGPVECIPLGMRSSDWLIIATASQQDEG